MQAFRLGTLTIHLLRPHRTLPQTGKCHRWTSPSAQSPLSPLLLQETEENMRWLIRCCHFFSYLLSKNQQALSNLSQCDHEKADKCIYILPYPVIIPAKLSPSSIHSYPLPPPLSSPSPDSHLSLSNPRWSLRSPSFISSRWFSRSESATTLWRRCRYWRQAYGGLGTPPVHITPHEWPKGRRKGGGRKVIWPISNCILLPQRTLHALSCFFSFPFGPLLH